MVFLESCRIVEKRAIAPAIFSLWLDTTKIAKTALPGQFISLRLPRLSDPFLRRPLAISDTQENNLRVVFRVRGRGTQLLSEEPEGNFLSILGPLGNPIPTIAGEEIVIVGGGIGIAPLLFLVKELAAENKILLFLGAKSKGELLLRDEFLRFRSEIYFASENGEIGEKGKVTELLIKKRAKISPEAIVFASGPIPLYREIRKIMPNKIYAFFEERMGCGTGLCLACVLPKKGGGYLHICKDGPVIDLNTVEI